MARPNLGSGAPFVIRRVARLSLTMGAAMIACCADGTTPASVATYSAVLSGVREVPSASTTATGQAMLTLTGTTLTYTVSASGFSTPLTVGHIHIAPAGAVGPVIVPVTLVAQTGTVAAGTVNLSGLVSYNTLTLSGDSLLILINAGQTYVNLHTAAYPGGEIRGQILRQ